MSQSGPYWSLSGWLSQPWCCSVLTEPLLSLTDYFRTPITAGNNWNHDVYGNPWQDQNHWALYGRLCHCEVCYLLASMELKLTSHQNIIWLNITSKTHVNNANSDISEEDLPMDESKLMYSFNCHYTLGNVEPCHVLRKCVILDEHGHEVSAREKFHY
jgi:hypothetical protein